MSWSNETTPLTGGAGQPNLDEIEGGEAGADEHEDELVLNTTYQATDQGAFSGERGRVATSSSSSTSSPASGIICFTNSEIDFTALRFAKHVKAGYTPK